MRKREKKQGGREEKRNKQTVGLREEMLRDDRKREEGKRNREKED